MDIYARKKAAEGVQISRNGMSIAFTDNHEDRSIQYSNHIGGSTRSNFQVGHPEKLKSSRPAFFSTGRKATAGSSSGAISTMSDKRKPLLERQSTPFLQERGTLGGSSREEQIEDFKSNIRQKEMVNSEVYRSVPGSRMVFPEPEVPQSSTFQGFSLNVNEASGNRQVTENSRISRPRYPVAGSGNQDASSSSVNHSVVPRNVSHTLRPSQNLVTNTHRYGIRNLSCTSISDVLPTGCSSDFGHSKRTDALRLYGDGGSSTTSRGTARSSTGRNMDAADGSARDKGIIRSLTGERQGSHRNVPSGENPSIVGHPVPHPSSRSTRNHLTGRDGLVLVQNPRAGNVDSRTQLLELIDDNSSLLPEPAAFPPPFQAQFSLNDASSATSSRSFSTSVASISQISSGRSHSMSRSTHTRHRTDSEDNNVGGFCRSGIHRDSYHHFNMEGIAEVLSALERIEQDDVLTYEELMVLESNLFFSGVSFRDRHRALRMDIDNMSYEELLALEEKMGTVSTALTEEALSTCLKRSIYMHTLRSGNPYVDDDFKCSICQEEYNVGDEVGKLHCSHRYHVSCIHQWLRHKNWCPICKSSACPS